MTSDRGLFVWHELNTTDVEAAERFYTKLIGWKITAWEPNPTTGSGRWGANSGQGCTCSMPS